MNNKFITVVIIVLLLTYIVKPFLNEIDSKYGETIPRMEIDQTIDYDTNIYNIMFKDIELRIDASHTGVDPSRAIIKNYENTIQKNWTPYFKKPNTVVVTIDFNDENVIPKVTGNDCCYTAAKAALEAVKKEFSNYSGQFGIEDNQNAKFVYKFTVQSR